ncbi:MAG: repeat-containing protein, partial [Planctomycetaceae bacterium]|nr:repeat-containing protein [Planctomycetaceae bacterium]
VSTNLIDNNIIANISNADHLSTTTGNVAVNAQELAAVSSHTFTAAAAVAISIGAAVSSATTTASDTLTNNVIASVESSHILSSGNVSITASDTSSTDAEDLAISLSVGLASLAVGVSIANNTVGGSVTADTDKSTVTISGPGSILVRATAQPLIATSNTVGAISLIIGVAAAGGSSNATVSTTTQSYVSDSTLTASGDQITVQASSFTSVNPQVTGFSGGLVSINGMNTNVNLGGQTRAYLGGTDSINASRISVFATDYNTATLSTVVAAGGVIAVNVANSNVNITRLTEAMVADGSNISIGGTNLVVAANSSSTGSTTGTSVTASLVSIGVMDQDVYVASQTHAAIGTNATILSSNGGVSVSAISANVATSELSSVGVGLLLNVTSGSPDAQVAGSTTAEILGNVMGTTSLTGAGDVTVNAQSNDRAAADLRSQSGGFINVDSSDASATANSTTTAQIGRFLTIKTLGNLTIQSQGNSEADASTNGSSGGFVTVNSINSYATSAPNVTSQIGDDTTITAAGTIAMTSSAPLNRDNSDQTRADSGDGYTTAASATTSGGFVNIQDANSTATVTPTVINHIGSSAQLTANQIDIEADATTSEEVLTVGAGGGFISAGGVDAQLSQFTRILNTIDPLASLHAADSISMNAIGHFEAYGNSSANIGGFVSFVSANTQLDVDYQVDNLIGAQANLQAGNSIDAEATDTVYAYGTSTSVAGGLGANSRSSNSSGTPDASDLKGVRIGHHIAETKTEVFDGAHLTANTITLAAKNTYMYARMEARSRAEGFGTDADGVANVDIFDSATVQIDNNAVVDAYGSLNLVADHSSLDATSFSRSVGASAFGDSDSTAITDVDSTSFVSTKPGSKLIAHSLDSESTYSVSNYDRTAQTSGGIDFGSSAERGDFNTNQVTDWEGDLTINGKNLDRKLVIAPDGSVQSAQGLDYQSSNGIVYGISGLVPTPDEVGSVRFHSNPIGTFDGRAGLASILTTSSFFAPAAPTITFVDTTRSININDLYTGFGFLSITPIDVVSGATPTITLDLNNIPTSGVAFNVKRDFEPTDITIQSTRTVTVLSINNPIGSTTIKAPTIYFDTITSHNVDLQATGDIGEVLTEFPGGNPVSRYSNIQLTQTSAGSPSLSINAGVHLTASITGLQRVNAPFVANIENITAKIMTIDFNAAKSQYSSGGVGPVTVQKTQPGKEIFFRTGTFTKSVFQAFSAVSGFFGFNPDQQTFNTDVFGQPNGSQTGATYEVHGRIEASDLLHTSIV